MPKGILVKCLGNHHLFDTKSIDKCPHRKDDDCA